MHGTVSGSAFGADGSSVTEGKESLCISLQVQQTGTVPVQVRVLKKRFRRSQFLLPAPGQIALTVSGSSFMPA